jgi:hypothetical protein
MQAAGLKSGSFLLYFDGFMRMAQQMIAVFSQVR